MKKKSVRNNRIPFIPLISLFLLLLAIGLLTYQLFKLPKEVSSTEGILNINAPTGTVSIPSTFTLGGTSVLTTGAELNFVHGVTSAVQTQINTVNTNISTANTNINLKANIASPTFTGTVTAPIYAGAVSGSSYGSIKVSGTTGSYGGIYLSDTSGTVVGMYDTAGNGGDWDPTTGWHTYWNRGNTSLGLGGSSTAAGYRIYVNGNTYGAGTGVFTGTVTAPSFYDSDPNYYVDPNGNTRLANGYIGNFLLNWPGYGGLVGYYGNYIYPGWNDSASWNQSYYIYGNSGNSGLRTNGNWLVDGNIYYGSGGVWLSSWLNQAVLTTSGPTFDTVYTGNWFRSSGQSGWYSSTYAVGVYATQAGRVDLYNGASLYVPGNISVSGNTNSNGVYVSNGYPFQSNAYNNNGYFAMNNNGTYWGIMGNYTTNDWRLGYGSATALTSWNLRWDASGNVWVNSALSVGGAVTASNFNVGTTNMNGNQFYCATSAGCYFNNSGSGITYVGNGAGTTIVGTTYGTFSGNLSGAASRLTNMYDVPTTYGTYALSSSKNNYYGLSFGTTTQAAEFMFTGESQGWGGLYYEAWGWQWYINGSNHNMGFKTSDTTYALTLSGNAANSTGVWAVYSDSRLKHDIAPINNALETILQLKPVAFNWNDPEKDKEFGRVRGFIAQDVEKVIPEWVSTGYQGYKAVQPIGIEAMLVGAIKEQQTQIVSLQSITTDFISKFKEGLIETKKLIVDGVDILKRLNELSDKVDKQQQTIDSQQKQIEDLKKSIEELKK